MDLLPACMSVLHLCGVPMEAGRVLHPLELELQMAESHYVFCKSSWCSQLLTHLALGFSFNVSLGNLSFCI